MQHVRNEASFVDKRRIRNATLLTSSVYYLYRTVSKQVPHSWATFTIIVLSYLVIFHYLHLLVYIYPIFYIFLFNLYLYVFPF